MATEILQKLGIPKDLIQYEILDYLMPTQEQTREKMKAVLRELVYMHLETSETKEWWLHKTKKKWAYWLVEYADRYRRVNYFDQLVVGDKTGPDRLYVRLPDYQLRITNMCGGFKNNLDPNYYIYVDPLVIMADVVRRKVLYNRLTGAFNPNWTPPNWKKPERAPWYKRLYWKLKIC